MSPYLLWFIVAGVLLVAGGVKLIHCGHKRERDHHHQEPTS